MDGRAPSVAGRQNRRVRYLQTQRPGACPNRAGLLQSHATSHYPRSRERRQHALFGRLENYGSAHITYSLYLSCRMGEIEYVENMLLSLVQALESLYNKVGRPLYGWPRNKGLDGKLRKILAFEEGLILDDQYLNEVIGDVVGIRNYLTHHGGSASEFKEKSEDLRVVASLCRKLEVAIQLHFVKQVELSAPETRGIFKMAACRLESTFRDSCYEK